MVDARVPTLLRAYWRFKYAILLAALLFALVLMPVIGASLQEHGLTRITLVVVMLACILATARSRAVMGLSAVLALVGESSYVLPSELAKGCHVLLFFLVSAIVLADVMQVEEVNADKIRGAVCGYMLMALGFAILYGLVATTSPGSFSVSKPSFATLTYFSFITISTLGYGDILPTSDASRALVAVEALIGQFYIAIVVARLISLQITVGRDIRPSQPISVSGER